MRKHASPILEVGCAPWWRPDCLGISELDDISSSVASALQLAGPDKSVDVISSQFVEDPTDPAWKDDKAMKDYGSFMKKYYPDGNPDDILNVYGYASARTLIHVLSQCGDDLTRQNVMRQAANF
jgi:branched-chain amino acid transport system substrate-binding protein